MTTELTTTATRRPAPDREDDVGQDEVETGVAVPAVPDGQPVEADERLEPGQSREQEDLEEREVGGEQARDPRDARQDVPGAVQVGDVAAVVPEPDDHGGVAEHDRPDERERRGPPQRSRAEEGGSARPLDQEG
jgi:hypothetical protein